MGMYERCEKQVEEGADEDGFYMQMMCGKCGEYCMQRRSGDDLCEAIAKNNIAMWARAFIEDEDIDKVKFEKAMNMMKVGDPASVWDNDRPGKHHRWMAGEFCESVSAFFAAYSPQ